MPVTLGGSAPPEALLRAMRRLGIRPVHGWGMTDVLIGAQSHLRPWMEGWPEELQVRDPWVAATYHRAEAPDGWTPDGRFRTGDVAVVDPGGQIRIVLAVAVPRRGQAPTPEELRAFLGQRFPRRWLLDAFVFVAEIPKTSTGKLPKAVLRERYRTWRWS